MTRKTLTAFAAALSLLTAACGGSDGDSTGPSPVPQTGTIQLGNQSNVNIIEVYISPCTSPTWGENHLDEGEVIAPGGVRSFTVDAGCYDIQAVVGQQAGFWYDRQVTAGGTLQIALSPAANRSRATIDGAVTAAPAARKAR